MVDGCWLNTEDLGVNIGIWSFNVNRGSLLFPLGEVGACAELVSVVGEYSKVSFKPENYVISRACLGICDRNCYRPFLVWNEARHNESYGPAGAMKRHSHGCGPKF